MTRLRRSNQVLQRCDQAWIWQLTGVETSPLHKDIVGLQRERLARVPAGHLPVNQQRLALAVRDQPQHHKGLLAGCEIMALDHRHAMA